MSNRSSLSGFLSVIVISLVFIVYFYHEPLLHPNKYLFGSSGDALKNYFTYAAHTKEPALINSEIMNYPYGENFLYLDCHPLLTLILKAVSVPFPGIINYSVGIINFLMIAAYVIASVFLFLILRRLKVNNILAVTGAVSIAAFSPQIYRIYGHFALSYSFMIPMTWYWFIRFIDSERRLKWSLIILVNNLLWYLMHGYMGMIAVSFITIAHISYLALYRSGKITSIKSWMYFVLQTLVPLMLFWLFIIITDIHTGRNKAPGGIQEYIANFYSVFLPHREPLKSFFSNYFEIKSSNWEGWSYIGLASLFMIVLFIINNVLKIIKFRLINDRPFFKNPVIVTTLISAVLILFLSMGYPFRLNMEYLLDHIKVINNFRAIGRFAWVFFFVITVWTVYYASLFYESRKKLKYLWLPVVLLIPVAFFLESLSYHKEASQKITSVSNPFANHGIPYDLEKQSIASLSDDYQAIIPLPFYLIGSEDYKKSATDKIYHLSMTLGYHTGLPLMANYSTNTGILESKNLYQLLAPAFYRKEVEKDIKSDKPFLLVYSKEDLNHAERNLLNRSRLLVENDKYALYTLSKNALFADSSEQYIEAFNKVRDELVDKEGFLIQPGCKDNFLKYLSYDSLNSNIVKSGKGAYQGKLKDYNLIVSLKPGEFIEGHTYIISFWMYNDNDLLGQKAMDGLAFIQYEDSKGQIQWPVIQPPAKSVNISGSWSLIELEYTIPDSTREYQVLFKGNDKSKLNCYIDELLIREKGCNIYKVLETDETGIRSLFYNNHHIRID